MKQKHSKSKKTLREYNRYKDIVKYNTEDDSTEVNQNLDSLQSTNETNGYNAINSYQQKNVERLPIAYRAKDWLEKYSSQLLIGAILATLGWNMMLQIGQAVQDEKIRRMEEDIAEIQTDIDTKYILKDVYNLEINALKEKINQLIEDLDNLKD